MKTSNIYLITFLILLLSSCSDDFLDKTPISNMDETNFFQTEEDFDYAVNGAYQTLYTIYAVEGPLSYTEPMTDNCTLYHMAGNTSDKFQFKDYSLLASNSLVNDFWNQYFNALYIINEVIEKLPESPLDSEKKMDYEAEMRFLRAIYYFDMVRLWGDVPLLVEPVTVTESYSIARTSANEIYSQIISDLEYSENNLPLLSEAERIGQATKGAAQGLLGKVYLTLGDNSNAEKYLKRVIDSKEYELLPNYSYLWDLQHENSKEALFEIQYIRGLDTPGSQYWQGFSPFENTMNMGVGMNQVTNNLWDEYEETDIRRSLSINDGYYEASGTWVEAKFPKKWTDMNSVISGKSRYSENNFITLRYADILLMYAETTGDKEYLNMVRRRAGVPEWGTPEYPVDKYSTFDLAIEHERRVEFAFEFHRWFDLKRTDRAISVLSKAKGKVLEDWQLFLPIPQDVIDQNPTVIEQNDGY